MPVVLYAHWLESVADAAASLADDDAADADDDADEADDDAADADDAADEADDDAEEAEPDAALADAAAALADAAADAAFGATAVMSPIVGPASGFPVDELNDRTLPARSAFAGSVMFSVPPSSVAAGS